MTFLENGTGTLPDESADIDIPAETQELTTERKPDEDAYDVSEPAEDAEDAEPAEDAENSEASDREEYERLIRTKFKELYAADTQKMINRRFKKYKALEEKVSSLEEALRQQTQTRELSDDELDASIDEYEQGLLERFPEYLAKSAKQNQVFRRLSRLALTDKGFDIYDAYKLSHFDEILRVEREKASLEAERRVTDAFRARKMRPDENAFLPRSAPAPFDVSRLTRSQRESMAKRAGRGEKIRF